MKLKLLVDLAGTTFREAGTIYDCKDDAEACRLVSARYALPCRDVEVERAVKSGAVEKAVSKPSARKKG